MTEPVLAGPTSKRFALPPKSRTVDRGSRWRGAAIGGIAGMLIGFFLVEFGLKGIVGHLSTQELFLLGLMAGAAVGAFRWYWVLIAIDGLMLLVYLAIANTGLMFGVALQWVRSDPLPASADAIVVLSSSVNSDGALDTQGVQRLLSGIDLFQRGLAPRLFTTSVEADHPNGILSSTADQGRLIKMGGASAAWTALSGVFTTRDEALQSAVHLPTTARTVIVVTSPMHTRRACATFEGVGFKVVCVASREHDFVTWHPLGPSDRMASFRDYLYERLGMVKYRSKGWIR